MPAIDCRPALCVVLHDVAPQTWAVYQPFVAAADRLGVPLTLLVVPDYHRGGDLGRHPDFVRALDARLAAGDEIALHGYFHADDLPLRGDPLDFLMRRVYTREAEFYRLPTARARQRIEAGLAMFAGFGWKPAGFVPPAWLMGVAASRALGDLPLRYMSRAGALVDLQRGRVHRAPSLVWSARNAWRRQASRLWNSLLLGRYRSAPLLRLGLHPVDMQHANARRFWTATLAELLTRRQALTKSAWLEQAG